MPTYELSPPFQAGILGATVQYSDGETFDIAAMLNSQGGLFTVNDPGDLVNALNSHPALQQSSRVDPNPPFNHLAFYDEIEAFEDNPQPGDILMKGIHGLWLSLTPAHLPNAQQGQSVIEVDDLGSAYTFQLPSRDAILIGNLTADCTITVGGLVAGSHFSMVLVQDIVGSRGATLSDGVNSLPLFVSIYPLASTFIECWSANGTDIIVTEG